MNLFVDRYQAGQALAANLGKYAGRDDALVLALPRGGVPVGFEVARTLDLPLDVFLVGKLGVPGNQELAMGAVAAQGLCVLNDEIVKKLRISKDDIFRAARAEYAKLVRREGVYRGDRRPVDVANQTAILVDDGLATGASMRAAIQALRQSHPARVVVAVPVAAAEACQEVSYEADETICAVTPEGFSSVGLWYQHFSPTNDEEVRGLLETAWRERGQKRLQAEPTRPS